MKTVIYGNGEMARWLYSYAHFCMEICGFTVDDQCIAKNVSAFCGLPLVPFSRVQEVFDPAACRMISGMGFIETVPR